MRIESIYDSSFKSYGKVLEGYDTAELLTAMKAIPLPDAGTAYSPAIDSLEACTAIFEAFRDKDEAKGIAALLEDISLAEASVRSAQQL